MQCEERVRRWRSHRTPLELDAQCYTTNSNCASRQSDRTRRREKEREAQERTREQRLVRGLLEKQLNPLKDGNASRMTTTFSILQSW